MKKTTFSIRTILYLLILGACTPSPEPVPPSPVQTSTLTSITSPALTSTPVPTSLPNPTFKPPPKVELNEIFYSNPRRLGDAKQTHEQLRAPEAGLITLTLLEGEYLVEVVGGPGAVPPNARVVIANLESRAYSLLTADDQGSFQESVLGFPGAHILIKQDSTGRISAFDSDENMAGTEFILAPGVIMQVPFGSREDDNVPVVAGYG